MINKKICVIGLGYIGLPTAAVLANKGYEVYGVDINEKIVNTVNKGNIHIVETDLKKEVYLAVSSGNLKAYTELKPCEIYIICVPTPLKTEKGIPFPNTDFILSVAKSIAKIVKSNDMIILESTSPVGTTEKIKSIILNEGLNTKNIHFAYCPERVIPGNIISELLDNDRIIGGITSKGTKEVAKFYKSFVRGNIVETSAKNAEMCKLVENSYRDVNIAFANELSLICDRENINVWELINLANKHPRVNILQPSTGVGGHCIAVDPWFIIARDNKNTRLIKSAREINDQKPMWAIDQIKNHASRLEAINGKKPKIL